jgi:hypothetical protein
MPKPNLPPHLVTDSGEIKLCSHCRKEFPADSKPSLSKAFAAHVRNEHKDEKPQPKKPA